MGRATFSRNRWWRAWDILQKAIEACRRTAEMIVAEVRNRQNEGGGAFRRRADGICTYSFLPPSQRPRLTKMLVPLNLPIEGSRLHFPPFPFNSTAFSKRTPNFCGS